MKIERFEYMVDDGLLIWWEPERRGSFHNRKEIIGQWQKVVDYIKPIFMYEHCVLDIRPKCNRVEMKKYDGNQWV